MSTLQRRLINPVNTTGRTKEQIVKYVENNILHNVLIDFNVEAHPSFCRCNKCFQAKLDAVVALGEVA